MAPLSRDPRITPPGELDQQDVCKIPDVSTEGPSRSRSGFPLSGEAGDPTRDLRVLAVGLSTSDSRFTENDRRRVDTAARQAHDYFLLQSYGRVTIDFSWADHDVEFAGTAVDNNWISTAQRLDRTDSVDRAVNLLTEVDLSNVDVLALFAPVDKRFDFGIATSPTIVAPGVPRLATLIGGSAISRWTTLAHELIHVWIGSEDLYSFIKPGERYMGDWDIMAGGIGNVELNSWLRWIAGWIVDSQVRCLGAPRASVHFIEGLSHRSKHPKMVVVRLTDHSAMVIDSRRTNTWGVDSWDDGAPTTLVYVVNTAFRHGEGPLRLRGELRDTGDSVTSDGVRITLLGSDLNGDLIGVEPTG